MSLSERFCYYVGKGDAGGLQQILDAAGQEKAARWLRCTDRDDLTPLEFAAREGHGEVCEVLLTFCKQLHADEQLSTADLAQRLTAAADAALRSASCCDALWKLLDQSACEVQLGLNMSTYTAALSEASPDATCPPLYEAAVKGDVASMQQLLASGVRDVHLAGSPTSPSSLATVPKSALEAAIWCSTQQVLPEDVTPTTLLQPLLAAATPEQLGGHYGFSAFSFATRCNAHITVVQQLLDAGAAPSHEGETVLQAATQHASAEVVSTVIMALVEKARSSGNGNSNGSSMGGGVGVEKDCFLAAANKGCADAVRLLLETAAQHLTSCMQQALHSAATNGHAAVVQLLLQHGADPKGEWEGCTALHAAVSKLVGNVEVIEALLDAGADPSVKSEAVPSYGSESGCDSDSEADPSPKTALERALADLDDEAVLAFLCHSNQPLSAPQLVEAAWEVAGAKLEDIPREFKAWDEYHESEAAEYAYEASRDESRLPGRPCDRQSQHIIIMGLLETAAAQDTTAAQAALSSCFKQVRSVHNTAKREDDYRGHGEDDDITYFYQIGIGNHEPYRVRPRPILQATLVLEAMTELWLGAADQVNDAEDQRNAVQHMLVSATASLKQLQHMQEADQVLQRERQLDLREQQLAECERQLASREKRVAAQERRLEKQRQSAQGEKAAGGPAAAVKRRRRNDPVGRWGDC